MHIKQNFNSIKVLYYGECYKEALKDCAVSITKSVASQISTSEVIIFNKKRMLRLILKLSIDTGDMYAVLADVRFPIKETKKIQETFSNYLCALCKEVITRR